MTATPLKDDRNDDHGDDMEAPLEEDFDTILSHIGVGKWNAFYYVAIAFWHVALPYHTVAGAFISPSVDHTCRQGNHTIAFPENYSSVAPNVTTNISGVSLLQDDSCSYLKENTATGNLEEVPCTEWDFDNSTFSSTVTSEFNLVCERRYLRAAHQSIYMSGILVGAFFNGFLADRYGRMTTISISATAYGVIALGSAWLPSLGIILASRFLLGTMHPASLTTGFILVMEVTEMKWRSTAGLLVYSFWSVGTALWGLFAYLERDWRWLQTYVSLMLPAILPLLYFMNESPRWLVVKGRHKEALRVIQRAARMNGTSLPPTDHLLTIMKDVQRQSTASETRAATQPNVSMARRVLNQVTILFSTKTLITVTIVTCIGFFSVAVIFFGLTLAASVMNLDNPFLYVGISGLMEVPAIITLYTVEKFGRKISGIGTFALGAVSLLMQPVIPASLNWLSITLVMIGKMAAASAFKVMFLYSSELYPTEIRTQAMCAGMMSSRVGAFISPFIISALEPTHPWAISVVFGLVCAVASVSFFPLWETLNTCLPDTLAQLEAQRGAYTRTPVSDTLRMRQSTNGEKTVAYA